MKYNLLKLLLLSLICTSCASYNYDSYTSTRNRTVTINSDNVNKFMVYPVGYSDLLAYPSQGRIDLILPNLKKRNRSLLLYNPDYDSIFISLKRLPRTEALIKDIGLSLFTLGVPIIVDLFKSDFYRVSPKTKTFTVHFEFSQAFMASEFKKIRYSNDPMFFQNWIKNYPKSVLMDSAVNTKDSLELSIALGKEKEFEIEYFIIKHPKSIYLNKAKQIQIEMIAARTLFETAKTLNTIESYQNYLSKYPRSLQNREAHRNLLNVAEKEALNSSNMDAKMNYLKDYLMPNAKYLEFNEFESKCSSFTTAVDNQLVDDNVVKNPVSKYDCYSKLWKAYDKIKNTVPQEYLRKCERTESYKKQIFALLFPLLQTNTTKSQQTALMNKIDINFPNIENGGDKGELIIDIIESTITKSGILKIWDVGYIPYLFKTKQIVYGNFLLGRESYFYNGSYNGSLLDGDISYEEISFSNGNLLGLTKCFIGNQIVFSLDIGKDGPKEISYFQDGILAKKTYFQSADLDHVSYYYEFVNGENITLKNHLSAIDNANQKASSGDFESAIYMLESLRKNNFPKESQINVSLDKALTLVISKQEDYHKQQERLRLAEERRIRELELAKELEWKRQWKKIVENSNNSGATWNILENNSGASANGNCSRCTGTGYVNCSRCNGTTEVQCRDCNGQGVNSYSGSLGTCVHCGGRGRKSCQACSSFNKGRDKCPSCNGSGRIR